MPGIAPGRSIKRDQNGSHPANFANHPANFAPCLASGAHADASERVNSKQNYPTGTATLPAESKNNRGHFAEALADLPLLVTRAQLAAILQCSQRHLANLSLRGLLPTVRLGRVIRYRRASVLKALERLEDTP